MQKNYSVREAAVFSLAANSCRQLFMAFSPASRLYFASNNIPSSLQPLQAHNTTSVSTEREGRSIRIRNYSMLSVVCTKIVIFAIIRIRDVHIKVAVSLQRNGLSSQYFPRTCKWSCHCEIRKNLEFFLPTYTTFPGAWSHILKNCRLP